MNYIEHFNQPLRYKVDTYVGNSANRLMTRSLLNFTRNRYYKNTYEWLSCYITRTGAELLTGGRWNNYKILLGTYYTLVYTRDIPNVKLAIPRIGQRTRTIRELDRIFPGPWTGQGELWSILNYFEYTPVITSVITKHKLSAFSSRTFKFFWSNQKNADNWKQ